LKPNYIEEATSMGAAIAAGIGVGMFKDFSAIDKFLKIEEIIKPNMDVHKKYNEILPLFNEAYHALVVFFNKLTTIC
jgi:xylulokinase